MLASFMFIANNKMYNEMFARNYQQSNLVVIIEFRLFIMLMILISLAHLSRRLIGELIGYSWSGVRLSSSSVHPSSTMLKDLLRNRWADQSQILCGASLGRGNDILFAASGS